MVRQECFDDREECTRIHEEIRLFKTVDREIKRTMEIQRDQRAA